MTSIFSLHDMLRLAFFDYTKNQKLFDFRIEFLLSVLNTKNKNFLI